MAEKSTAERIAGIHISRSTMCFASSLGSLGSTEITTKIEHRAKNSSTYVNQGHLFRLVFDSESVGFGGLQHRGIALVARDGAIKLLYIVGLGNRDTEFFYLERTRVADGIAAGFRLAVVAGKGIFHVHRRWKFIYHVASGN